MAQRQHLHILGIAGTFMGGLAQLARAAGHRVTGADRQVYPPMSTQLEAAGIAYRQDWDPAQLEPAPDVVVVGNVMRRGLPIVEALLEAGIPYTSGPQWLAEHVLAGRHVLAVAGTHGKTTTASMLAWILEVAGLAPGFLIGGVPRNFGRSARPGRPEYFVIEADEYDTAFFDKRAKFVHYRPRTLVINNLEYDHADIYPDLAAIQRQFHHLVRTVPGGGRILAPAGDAAVAEVLAMGCWTPVQTLGEAGQGGDWFWRALAADGSRLAIGHGGEVLGELEWDLLGAHNAANALAAVAAAHQVGVPVPTALEALRHFRGVKRRLELRGEVGGVRVYDDFAHHPTAIATTVTALRRHVGADARILVAFEPRSNTMRMGVHRDSLAAAFRGADALFALVPAGLDWDLAALDFPLPVALHEAVPALAEALAGQARPGDHILVMSNGGFGGLHERLLDRLRERFDP